jgi:hypothetical protein
MAAVLLLLLAAPARADTRQFTDAVGDMTSGQQIHPGDIESVTVSHENRLRVTVRHNDLQPDYQVGASVFIDTDPGRPGPELVLTGGLFEGTDYYLTKAQDWKSAGEHLTCFHRIALNYAEDTSTFIIGRSCLGDADQLSIASRVTGPSMEAVDWLKGRRLFTPSVAR